MKIRLLASFLTCIALTFMSCDDTTDTIGSSITDEVDKLDVFADTFGIASNTVIADSVLARNIVGYLGRVKDPETGSVINSDFMVQFATLEGFTMPDEDSIMSRNELGEIIADSCEIRLYYNDFYGDSLSQMKLTAYEMDKPLEESQVYYSNFDPYEKGYIRADGIKQSRTYTLADLTEEDSIRTSSDYTSNIRIRLNGEYTDNDGVKYNNYGTYLMHKYYENPENFRNSYKFIHNVVPGYFFKMKNGLGSMAYIDATQLYIYFKYTTNDTTLSVSTSFTGTEEVLQTTTFSNDKERIEELAMDNSCTYLKTPSGLFTELTLPVEEIMTGHENDTINTARTEIKRMVNTVNSEYSLDIPDNVLMIPTDSLDTFFANNKLFNNKTSYVSQYSSTRNSYTFGNISGLINAMYNAKKNGTASENWNKVLLIPVSLSYSASSSSSSTVTKLTHDMSLTSTRLVRGDGSKQGPITISVIYSRFNGR